MSTIIRVKRKLNEEQAVDEKIVLNIKKQRVEENVDKRSEEKTILKFAGTVDQNDNTEENILKLTKTEAERIVSRKNLSESKLQKRLIENKEKAQRNRFTVLNYTRSTKLTEEEDEKQQKFTIVDVEKEKQTAEEAATSSSSSNLESEYVYDIYIAEKTPTSSILNSEEPLDINDLSILEYNDYLYSCPRLTQDSDDDEFGEDSSDSNDENYYKNDYPDESDNYYSNDDNESIGEREMIKAMRRFDMDNELSSDEEDEKFVYSVDAEGIEFEDDLDFSDAARYGPSYARYKKRMLREMENDNDEDDD